MEKLGRWSLVVLLLDASAFERSGSSERERVTPEKVNCGCAFVSLFDGMTLAFGRVWAA
jgi:hypothetical protein